MMVRRIVAIIFIFIGAFIAWMILGVSNMTRTEEAYYKLKDEVVSLYGDAMTINSPECYACIKEYKEQMVDGKWTSKECTVRRGYELSQSDISIDIQLDQRKKGNLWFPTFKAKYSGSYQFKIDDYSPYEARKYYIYTTLESANSIYNNIELFINDQKISQVLPLVNKEKIEVKPTEEGIVKLRISYECTGMDQLTYYISPQQDDIKQINDLTFTVTTDFKDYDFPSEMMSPTEIRELDDGYELIWQFNKSITGKDIGIIIPNKLNPGEIVSRVTFFAPVSLLFFFVAIFIISIMLKVNIHPMNYFFLAATFFSFHLMYSYFSDHMSIYLTFGIASFISLFLTVTYMRVFTPKSISYLYAPLTQLIYLIIFSFSFFFKGMTGLIVTICSVITLFILMQITAKVKWEQVFGKNMNSPASQ